ncbi:uncharacterized protein LOC132306110 isoform X2 [Cornus florida]|uniref:uncharacterized protein LOC132306110 isoform X2 n=1 Tax=Cornus florida TaxID=4283 RepID=UPI0028A1952B|nr:uncharacterized protein LOC132306110 isoform X2 [Cornus florida]
MACPCVCSHICCPSSCSSDSHQEEERTSELCSSVGPMLEKPQSPLAPLLQSFCFHFHGFPTLSDRLRLWCLCLLFLHSVGTAISVRGCWRNSYSKKTLPKNGESDEFMKKDLGDSIKLQSYYKQEDCDHKAGFWEYLMQAIYQTSAGAAILTDIVFWCILVPFLLGENFHLTLLIGCMHSLNAVFLLIDSAINSLPFPWYRLTYFVLWSVVYVIFHWLLHAFGFTNWWPYPFLDLSSPWAPLWYLGLGLVHIPCYGLYVLLMRAKNSIFSRMFPSAFGCSFL